MQKTIILWLSAIVITFLVGYIHNISDETYPVSGTIGINGQKVSYMFEKIHYGIDPYQIIIRTDVPDLTGKIKWRSGYESKYWYKADLVNEDMILRGEIPSQSPLEQIEYNVELSYSEKEYNLPGDKTVKLTFYAKVPKVVMFLNGFLIYLILFLAIRTGLENFSTNQKIKKYSFVIICVVLIFTALIHPLYLSYKFGYINHAIPPVANLFPVYAISFLVVWIIFTIVHFKVKEPKLFAAAAGLLTIAIYLLLRF